METKERKTYKITYSDRDLHTRFKNVLKEQGISQVFMITKFIKVYLQEYENKKGCK